MSIDTKEHYFNFRHPHRWAKAGNFKHRLGNFRCKGRGKRKGHPMPDVGVLHVPGAEIVRRNGRDFTAERMAAYLADPPEKRSASVHLFADRDSCIICLPFDSVAYGCGNKNTYERSIEIEIAGTMREYRNYWRGLDAEKKLRWAAKGVVYGSRLAFGVDWRRAIPSRNRAELAHNGGIVRPGWTQHREIPIWDKAKRKYAQPPVENLKAGQHADICANFPYDVWFEMLESEIRLAAGIKK